MVPPLSPPDTSDPGHSAESSSNTSNEKMIAVRVAGFIVRCLEPERRRMRHGRRAAPLHARCNRATPLCAPIPFRQPGNPRERLVFSFSIM
ncbi:hypothetical protein ACVBGC_05545 [Burkholderia stagnalis]